MNARTHRFSSIFTKPNSEIASILKVLCIEYHELYPVNIPHILHIYYTFTTLFSVNIPTLFSVIIPHIFTITCIYYTYLPHTLLSKHTRALTFQIFFFRRRCLRGATTTGLWVSPVRAPQPSVPTLTRSTAPYQGHRGTFFFFHF